MTDRPDLDALDAAAARAVGEAMQELQEMVKARLTADPDWLSIADVARRLSVSTWQVRKWIECGQFDEIVVFSRKLTRISLGSYHRFVAKNQQVSA